MNCTLIVHVMYKQCTLQLCSRGHLSLRRLVGNFTLWQFMPPGQSPIVLPCPSRTGKPPPGIFRTLSLTCTRASLGGGALEHPPFQVREPLSDRLPVRLRVVPLLIPKGRLQVTFEEYGSVILRAVIAPDHGATDGTNGNAKLTTRCTCSVHEMYIPCTNDR